MRVALFLIPLALSSAGCSSGGEFARDTGTAPPGSATVESRPAVQRAAPVRFEDDAAEGEAKRTFRYAWPAQVTAIPQLAARLAKERDGALTTEKAEWAQTLGDVEPDCVPCRTRGYAKEWKVVADTPDYLSLSAQTDTYTGGAHGNYGLESLVWHKRAQRALNGVEMFQSAAKLEQALGSRLCAALNAERERKRGEPVRPVVEGDTGFAACQKVEDGTVLVGSSTGKAFDRVGIWFGPYVAGPYAEGAYELDFPVDAAVLRAVKPEFTRAFAVR